MRWQKEAQMQTARIEALDRQAQEDALKAAGVAAPAPA